MEKRGITFGIIRKFCSHIDRISICMKETLQYENFRFITHVPQTYDKYFLYGFGMIKSEFDDGFKECIEIMLSEEPRDDI